MLEHFIDRAKKQAEQVEVYQVTSSETPVRFEFNRLKGIDTSEKQLTALRLVKDGRLGFATTTGANLDELLEAALTTARFGRNWDLQLPGPAPLPETKIFDQATAETATDRMVELGQEVIDLLTKIHPEVLAAADLTRRETTVQLTNSNGFSHKYKKSSFCYMASAELTQGQNFLSVYSGFDSCKLENQIPFYNQYLTQAFKDGQTNVPIQSGNFTVIFTPDALTDVIRPLLACANGKAVEKGFSPWRDKLNQPLFAPEISLYDDAAYEWGPATCPFDAEGVPTGKLPIIEQGIVRNFLLDLTTAKALNMPPTGNGFRAQAGELPSPGNSNIILESTKTIALKDLTNIKRGLIIHSLMGAWAGNPYSGQVSGNIALGFLIEEGQVKGRVKDCMVSINAFDAFLNQLDGVSSEKNWAWAMLLPHIRFSEVPISAKK